MAASRQYGGHNHHSLPVKTGPLPKHQSLLALDVGGSLAKIAYVKESKAPTTCETTTINLVTFDTEAIDDLLDFLKTSVLGAKNSHKQKIYGTGTGCLKHKNHIEESLDVELISDCEEMKHAVKGLDFMWRKLDQEKLLYPESEVTSNVKFHSNLKDSGLGTCMLSNMGSALSIVQMNEDASINYIGGGITAGLTFLGLGALLTGSTDFVELQKLAENGDRSNIDLFVKDTAGSTYNFASPDSMVSSFGRVAKEYPQNPDKKFRPEDLASSLLYNIVDQLASTTYLVGKAHNISTVVFCGSFLAGSGASRKQIKTKLQQCSVFLQHEIKPVFVCYEHYLGAIGALVYHLEELCTADRTSAS